MYFDVYGRDQYTLKRSVFIPPYGSMGVFSLLCVFVCLFVCLYGYKFLSGEKGSSVKLCMLSRLLSKMSFSHFGELWLA